MVLQTTGVSPPPTPGSTSPLDLSNSEVGRWELARILWVNIGQLQLAAAMVNSFPQSLTQVVVVPECTTVVVNAGGELRAAPWDGGSGGVLAFFAQGDIVNDGLISANGAGFRPGQAVYDGTSRVNCSGIAEAPPNGAIVGEGVVASVFGSATGQGNVGNGGAGGVCRNSGGGGAGGSRKRPCGKAAVRFSIWPILRRGPD